MAEPLPVNFTGNKNKNCRNISQITPPDSKPNCCAKTKPPQYFAMKCPNGHQLKQGGSSLT
jgi:hypothetical protein